MSGESDLATHRLLGELNGKLAGIEKSLKSNDANARDALENLHHAVQDIRNHSQQNGQRLDNVERVLEIEVRPVVRGVLDWRSRAVGALAVIGFIGTAIIFAITAAKEVVLEIWRVIVDR